MSLCVGVCTFTPLASAQSIAGQIVGTVTDPGGSSVPDAKVTITNTVSKVARTYNTQANGTFSFPGLFAGDYDLHIEKTGFKSYDQKAITLASGETADLHELRLSVGDVSSSVTVEAETARLQTDSSDHIQNVNATQIEDVPNPSHAVLDATRLIAGTQSTGSTGGGGINGGNSGTVVLQLDGIIQQDSGAPSSTIGTGRVLVNIEAVNEVQVQANVMNAEFGSRSGGQVVTTTKNGTAQFHGSLYTYLRNEDFNANSFFNNKTGVVRARSRFQNPGGTIGGPVLLPFLHFNRNRNKMYFFYAEDEVYNHNANTQSYTMPTAREKTGDYSQTTTTKGALIKIIDPTSGSQFTGNVIPASRISAEGAAMLNLFPTGCSWDGTYGASGSAAAAVPLANFNGVTAPCIVDPTGNRAYNTQSTFVTNSPTTTRTLRVDYNIFKNTTMYARLYQSLNNSIGVGSGQTFGGTSWGLFENTNPQNGRGDVVSVITTFRPNLVGEFTGGENFVHQQNQPANPTKYLAAGDLSNFKYPGGGLVNPTEVFSGNFQNLIPNVSFSANKAQSGGQAYVSGTPSYGWDSRWPFDGTDGDSSYAYNLTWIKGKHTVKGGFYYERVTRNVSVYSVYNTQGTYYFGTDTANPNDTGYPVSNLLTGAIQSFGQDNIKQVNHARYNQYEWYIQDTWKVNRKLNIDYGIRLQLIPQIYSARANLGLFNASLYNASKTGTLLFPTCTTKLPASGTCPVANTAAVNPNTGAIYPGVAIGLFDPKSYAAGTFPYSGIQQFPDGKIFTVNHPQFGPRIGFAYDPFGNAKWAIRGGFGIFYNRAYSVDTIASNGSGVGPLKIPPQFQDPTYFDTTFAGLATAQPFLGPESLNGGSATATPLNMPDPNSYQWNIGVQRDLGKGLVMDVSYIGNVYHHGQGLLYNANGIPVDTVWSPTGGANGTLNPKFVNPANTTQVLPINLVRALIGYNGLGDLTSFTATGESFYDSLQTQVNKRFGKQFTFTSNWTWQKTTNYSHNQYLPNDQLTKSVSNRKQAVNIGVNYSVPTITNLIGKNVLTTGVFDGWHIDGVMAFFSGDPLGISCNFSSAPAGYPNGQDGISGALPGRCAMTGSLFLSGDAWKTNLGANGFQTTADPRLVYPLNVSSFQLPGLATNGFGNAPPTLFWGPGFENIDASVYKSFRIVKETNQLQLRADVTNIFNHFNPADPNTSLTYVYTSGQQTTANFGQVTSQQGGARAMSLSLRFRF